MTFCPFSGIWEKQKSHMCCFSFPFAGQLHKHRQFGIFHEQLSIDEGMLPYYGHHSCKMFIRGKPIRFGYKIWTMSSANGYPYALKIYAGRDERKKNEPLGMKVIEEIISVLERPEWTEFLKTFHRVWTGRVSFPKGLNLYMSDPEALSSSQFFYAGAHLVSPPSDRRHGIVDETLTPRSRPY
ncbi:PiggyBac transposable element-derived protein 3 [Trichinella britovi]|uniref:PiggyBac transposable element-derived protein 3 n=1 Tax=Trichinella britovi TaxID=45882 RepID=A0A0V1C7D8_TRIBR|nr:PiggyBac transposable element-derived protein 3 [Trichinella britovi]